MRVFGLGRRGDGIGRGSPLVMERYGEGGRHATVLRNKLGNTLRGWHSGKVLPNLLRSTVSLSLEVEWRVCLRFGGGAALGLVSGGGE